VIGGPGDGGLTPEQRRLVEEWLHVVEAIARTVHRCHPRAEYDEIYAAACEAFTRRVRAFDPARGARLTTFVWRRVLFAAREAAEAPPLSPAAMAALDAADEIEDETSAFAGEDEDFERHVLESGADVGAAYTVGFAAGVIQRLGEEGVVLLEESARVGATLRAAVASLPAEDRQIFRLRLLDRRPAREVAATLGVSKSTLDRRCRALREHLRRALEAQGISAAPAL
jgi:RNA polymerase sigma factor (sigma-70 family)